MITGISFAAPGAKFVLACDRAVLTLLRVEVRSLAVTPQVMHRVSFNDYMLNREHHAKRFAGAIYPVADYQLNRRVAHAIELLMNQGRV